MVRRRFAVLGVVVALAAPAATAGARTAPLSHRRAVHVLRGDLRRLYAFDRVRASCRRRTRTSFRCHWRGHRRDGRRYRGAALVRRRDRRVLVQLEHVRRV